MRLLVTVVTVTLQLAQIADGQSAQQKTNERQAPPAQPGRDQGARISFYWFGVADIAFSNDSNTVAVVKGSIFRARYTVNDRFGYRQGYKPYRGGVEVWTDGKLKHNFNDLEGHVIAVGLSADGRTLVTASWEPLVRTPDNDSFYSKAVAVLKAWNTDTGKQIWVQKGFDSDLFQVAFSPNGSVVLASGADSSSHAIKVFDAQTGAQTKKLGMKLPNEIAFAPDGKTLAVIDNREKIVVLETAGWNEVRTIRRDNKRWYNVAFSPDGRSMLARMSEMTKVEMVNEIGFFDAMTGQPGRVLQMRRHKMSPARTAQTYWSLNSEVVTSIAFLWDASIATINRRVVFQTWDPVTLQEKSTGISKKSSTAVTFSPDGRRMAIAVDPGGMSWEHGGASVALWDLKTDALSSLVNPTEYDDATLRTITISVERVSALAFAPSGSFLASAGGDEWRIWDLTSGSELQRQEVSGAGISTLALSTDGKLVVTGGRDGELRLWEASSGKLNLTLKGSGESINAVAFSPDGRLVAAGAKDGSTGLWELPDGKFKAKLQGHPGGVAAVCFSLDGKMLATGGADSIARLWNPATGEAIGEALKHNLRVSSLAFSPDSKALASGCVDGWVQIWDTANGQPTGSFKAHGAPLNALVWSPDGKLLATGSDDRTVKLWTTQGWKELQALKGHEISVYSLAFSPNGDTLAAGTGNNVIALWDPRTGTIKRMLRDRSILPSRSLR
jgi:WD40 repeat protein